MLVNGEHLENEDEDNSPCENNGGYLVAGIGGGASILALDPIYLRMHRTKYAVCRQDTENCECFILWGASNPAIALISCSSGAIWWSRVTWSIKYDFNCALHFWIERTHALGSEAKQLRFVVPLNGSLPKCC